MTASLIVVSGLPGVGKTTVATRLAQQTRTPYVRVDLVEQAIVDWTSLSHPLGPVGYAVAHQLAGQQLRLGLDVVVECVNPIAATRDAWLSTADAAGGTLCEVELVCSDPDEHRRRVDTRTTDVPGLTKPRWSEVAAREYEPWTRDHLVMDTSALSIQQVVDRIIERLDDSGRPDHSGTPAT
jgi:predicted kinase